MAYTTNKVKEILALISGSTISGNNLTATGAAPDTNTASTVVIGQKDSSVASKATLDIETEEVAVTEAITIDTTISVWVNGVEYKLGLEAV